MAEVSARSRRRWTPEELAELEVHGPLLSLGEVAAIFRVGPKTASQWERDGRLPACLRTPGGHRRFAEKDLAVMIGGDWTLGPPELLTPDEAGRILHASGRQVISWARQGKLRRVGPGRARFHATEIYELRDVL